jgi:hypothetical protein
MNIDGMGDPSGQNKGPGVLLRSARWDPGFPKSETDLEVAGTLVFQKANRAKDKAEGLTIAIYPPKLANG